MTFASLPGTSVNRERSELWPLPRTLPPRTSREPCLVPKVECSASAAAAVKNRWCLHIWVRGWLGRADETAPDVLCVGLVASALRSIDEGSEKGAKRRKDLRTLHTSYNPTHTRVDRFRTDP